MIQKKQRDETNALLAAVVASSMDAVFSIDANARIQTWNKAAERLYGYTADEAIGQPLRLLAPDPASYAPGDLFRRALHGEQIYFENPGGGWDQLRADPGCERERGRDLRRSSRHFRTQTIGTRAAADPALA